MSIPRRQFLKVSGLVFGSAACAVPYWLQHRDPTLPSKTILDIWETESPGNVVSFFANAKTPTLMATYGYFFPNLFMKYGRDAMKAIQVEVNQAKLQGIPNAHRLEALPAVCAAHRLARIKDSNERGILCNVISDALRNQNRQVLQIVTQNLISAVAPNPDSSRFFALDGQVLRELGTLIAKAEDDEQLLTPASVALQFLLNASSLLEERAGRAPYEKVIAKVQQAKSPHFWYLRRLVELHRRTFRSNPSDITSLPPQYEEALMGWQGLIGARGGSEYFAHLALIKCRQSYMDFATREGRIPSGNAMTDEQAAMVLPKSISFVKDFKLLQLLNQGPSLDDSSIKLESRFRTFLLDQLPGLLSRPQSHGVDLRSAAPLPSELRLAECVPFARYRDHGVFQDVRETIRDAHHVDWGLLGSAIVGGFYGHHIGADFDDELGAKHPAWWRFVARRFGIGEVSEIPESVREESRKRADTVVAEIDRGAYPGVDQEQHELGDLPLPDYETG